MHIYQVFHLAPSALGNLAAVQGLMDANGREAHPPGSKIRLPGAVVQCHVSHRESNRYRVECYQGNQKIQCCGHGLLAVAYALFESGVDDSRVELGEGVYAERISSGADDYRTWLYLPAIPAEPVDLPSWASHIFSTEDEQEIVPVAAAATSDDNGYLLLHLDGRIDLERLDVDIPAISANTAQAVLAWQIRPEDPRVVWTRYFAPQYGNDEDAATGSVLRVLAPHLNHVAGLDTFSVFQCSRQGGRMMVRNDVACVAISGNVQSVDSKELPAQ